MDLVARESDPVNAKRILIISSDAAYRDDVRRTLEDAGIDAAEGTSAADAVTAAGPEVHAVVLDRESFLAADAEGTLEYIATQGLPVPFLVTTARDE